MPRVTVDTVDHVARLAHLSLTDEEQRLFAQQLDQILAYAEALLALDTADVPPMSHASTARAFREDSPRGGLEQDRALAGAPDASEGLFRVPRVIGG
jgi:aspartyl-tRNA(Asn)/glutamyl-tRNA(Gln) amidotransferase subunit C